MFLKKVSFKLKFILLILPLCKFDDMSVTNLRSLVLGGGYIRRNLPIFGKYAKISFCEIFLFFYQCKLIYLMVLLKVLLNVVSFLKQTTSSTFNRIELRTTAN